jgi:hypothetical protein
MRKVKKATEEAHTRIAIVNGDKCKPKKCAQECKKLCPVVRTGYYYFYYYHTYFYHVSVY